MPIEVKCAECARQYILADNVGGGRVVCTQCRHVIDVPYVLPEAERGEVSKLVVEPEPERRRRLLVPVMYGVGLLMASAIILAILILPRLHYAGQQLEMEQCGKQLQRIGAGMLAFARDHHEKLPYDPRGPLESLSLLYPKYVDDPKVFVCASAPKVKVAEFPKSCTLAGHGCSFLYDAASAGGAAAPKTLEPDAVIITEVPGSHPGDGGNILCADGHVEWRDKLPPLGEK